MLTPPLPLSVLKIRKKRAGCQGTRTGIAGGRDTSGRSLHLTIPGVDKGSESMRPGPECAWPASVSSERKPHRRQSALLSRGNKLEKAAEVAKAGDDAVATAEPSDLGVPSPRNNPLVRIVETDGDVVELAATTAKGDIRVITEMT